MMCWSIEPSCDHLSLYTSSAACPEHETSRKVLWLFHLYLVSFKVCSGFFAVRYFHICQVKNLFCKVLFFLLEWHWLWYMSWSCTNEEPIKSNNFLLERIVLLGGGFDTPFAKNAQGYSTTKIFLCTCQLSQIEIKSLGAHHHPQNADPVLGETSR